MTRVLITGGFGYVGGRLAVHLSRRPAIEITLGTRMPSVAQWLPSATVARTDWQSEARLRDVCNGIDSIVHLAGMNAQDCAADPVGALEINAVATARLVRAAATAGVRRFIYVSTAHVYGSPLQGTVDESTCPMNLHPYATSHLAGEHTVGRAHEKKDIEGISVRLSNAFGAPADLRADCWSLLVNALCRQAVVSCRMELATPHARRDFLPMRDACAAIEYLLDCDASMLGDGIFNVGSGRTMSVAEMAQTIASVCERTLGYRPEIISAASDAGVAHLPLQYRSDKLLGLGFTPTHDMPAEIAATLQLFAANKEQLTS